MKYVLCIFSLMLASSLAHADPDLGIKSVMSHDEIAQVISKLGSPDAMKSIQPNGNHIAMVWQYTGRIDGKNLYIITNQEGQPDAVTIGGQTVAVVKR